MSEALEVNKQEEALKQSAFMLVSMLIGFDPRKKLILGLFLEFLKKNMNFERLRNKFTKFF
jgi:hypothetical protein